MLRVLIAVPLAVLALLLMPSKTDAYGAARFGYTHVGPGGFYHVGGYEARGYGGVFDGGGIALRVKTCTSGGDESGEIEAIL